MVNKIKPKQQTCTEILILLEEELAARTRGQMTQELVDSFGSRKKQRSMAAAIAARISDETTIIGVDSATKLLEARAAELPGLYIFVYFKLIVNY